MRALLTSGIKAILAIAALSTAAHWALRVQREPAGLAAPALASLPPDPVTTGSIAARQTDRPQPDRPVVERPLARAPEPAKAAGLDQSHLAALIATAGEKPKVKAAKR